MTIRLQTDPESGKKNIIVSLRPDEDQLPHEHEEQHKALVDKLIEGGMLKASEVGKVVIEREEEAPVSEAPAEQQPQRESESEGA